MKSLAQISAVIALSLSWAYAHPIHAQSTAFLEEHHSSAVIPVADAALFVVDTVLYCSVNGVIHVVHVSNGVVTNLTPDTVFVKMDEDVDYVTRHPVSGDLYFTVKDKKGVSQLYCHHLEPGKNPKIKRVDLGDLSIEHPTFSADGRFMVFSSMGRNRRGKDLDLWYSQSNKGAWESPRNMGNRVNTRMDEKNPVINGEYLYFSSGGHEAVEVSSMLYVTPLVARQIEGDTVGMLQIGRARVLRMPSPVNMYGSTSTSIAFDVRHQRTYWLRSDGDGTGVCPLYSLSGTLDARYLWGYVHRVSGEVLADVSVTAWQGSLTVATTTTDSLGFYSLYLPCNSSYVLRYSTPGCFTDTVRLPAIPSAGEYPVLEVQRDVSLDGIPLRSLVYYYDLFEPNVSLNLSKRGCAVLAPLVRFLIDNPDYHARLLLTNDITDDAEFNGLLTEQRLKSLRDYLTALLPSSVKIDYWNGCQGGQSCASASGMSRLTVVIQP